APAERWIVDGGPYRVGVIASVTRPFCRACDRTRLTADGQVRSCLFAREETDLRGPLREGASHEEIPRRRRAATWGRTAGSGLDAPGFRQPSRPMSAIGGCAPLPLRQRHRVLQKAAGPRETRQVLAVLLAGEPGLAALRGVQAGVVPGEDPHGV